MRSVSKEPTPRVARLSGPIDKDSEADVDRNAAAGAGVDEQFLCHSSVQPVRRATETRLRIRSIRSGGRSLSNRLRAGADATREGQFGPACERARTLATL